MRLTARIPRLLACAAVALVAADVPLSLELLPGGRALALYPARDRVLHYAPNDNFGPNGDYLPGRLGFNLADVNTVDQINGLEAGVKGLVWIGQCGGVDIKFLRTVQPYARTQKLFGFYLMDDPDPRDVLAPAKLAPRCAAEDLRAESDWIHTNIPGALTLIVLMNMSSSKTPSFDGTYNPANSHVDLFGLSPYPCRTELNGCEYEMIDRYVTAAESSGVPRSRMVPIYQVFGGGEWRDDVGGQYVLPTPDQERQILARWRALVEAPILDMAYSWGSQKTDVALETATDLKEVFSLHNKVPNLR
jgi:hypothetical protein